MTNRWLALALLIGVRSTFAFQFGSVSAVSPFLIQELGIDYAALGTLVSLYLLPGIVVSMPSGLAGSRFGERAVAIAGLVLIIVGGLMSAAAETYALAAAGRIVAGIGSVFLNVMLTKMVMDWFAGREMATAMALFLSSWPLGIAAAMVALAPLAEAASLAAVFGATALVGLTGLVAVAALYRPAPGAPPPAKAERPRVNLLAREMWLVSLASISFSFCSATFVALIAFVPLHLVEAGQSATAAAQIASIAPWTYALGVPLGGIWADRSGRAGAIVAAACIAAVVGIALMPVAVAWTAALLAVVGFASALPQSIIKSVLADILRPEARAPGLGFHLTWHYSGLSVLPPVLGALADWAGTPLAAVAGAAVLMAVAGAFYGWTRVGLAKPVAVAPTTRPS